jgi:PD-(D/E)XK endonuclease
VAPLKQKGDLAELMVAADLRRRGFKLAFPYGEDWDYDLIIEREGRLERLQVKYTKSDGAAILVRAYSLSLTNGKVRSRKHYTAETIDWLAVYDVTSERCYYVPASELGNGMNTLTLRLSPTRNGQHQGIRFASDYLGFQP